MLVQATICHGMHGRHCHKQKLNIHGCLSQDLDLAKRLKSRQCVRCLKHNPPKIIRKLDSKHWSNSLQASARVATEREPWPPGLRKLISYWLWPWRDSLTNLLSSLAQVGCPDEPQNLSQVHRAHSTHWKHLCRPENEASLPQCNFLSTSSMWTSLLCVPSPPPTTKKKSKRKRKSINFKRNVGPCGLSHSVVPPNTGSCPLWQLHPAVLFESWPQKRKVKRNVKGKEFLSGEV